MTVEIQLTINGSQHTTRTDLERPLLDVLREDFQLTGTKYGCGEGLCGACTVLVDGTPTRSCITSIGEVTESEIETIEGIASDTQLHPVQQAFLDHQAMQCGYCVPGHIMTAVALARTGESITSDEIIAAMSGHICRCCNYENIRAAVAAAIIKD